MCVLACTGWANDVQTCLFFIRKWWFFFFSREKKHVSTMLSQACVSWAAKLTVSDRVWVRFKNQEKTPKENIYTSVVFLLSCNLVGITFADLIQQGVSVPVIRFYFRSNRFCYNAFVVVGSNCVLPVMSHTAFLVLWCGWFFLNFFFLLHICFSCFVCELSGS